MKDDLVAGLNRLIARGGNLFVEGMDVRTPEEGKEWQGRADQFAEEAKAWVKEQSPADAVRLETLSPYLAVGLPLDNPWRRPTSALSFASSTSSILCEENNPVIYHLALVTELKEIVSDWRVNPPGRKTGPKPINLDKQMSTAKHLRSMNTSKLAAATLAVKEHGRGGCASDAAAIDKVRKNI